MKVTIECIEESAYFARPKTWRNSIVIIRKGWVNNCYFYYYRYKL